MRGAGMTGKRGSSELALPKQSWSTSAAGLEAILASIDDHVACYDRQWRYTFVNDKAAEILGKTQEELLGHCVWDLFPDAVGNLYFEALHAALAQQRVIRQENYYAPFDRWFENHIYPTPDGVI